MLHLGIFTKQHVVFVTSRRRRHHQINLFLLKDGFLLGYVSLAIKFTLVRVYNTLTTTKKFHRYCNLFPLYLYFSNIKLKRKTNKKI